MRIGFPRLVLAGALAGLALPCLAAAPASPPQPTAAKAGPGVLTLYSEPGLRGRRATYRTASLDVERQGFMARSAASTGMWTLCEGGQVVSRCQTVDGQAPELNLAPQIARPGLNALALYDQPGLKGRRVVYSFPADRPAPFHARSARTWGGPWSLCERGFRHCQSLEGRMVNLDLVVEAVRPEAGASGVPARPPRPPRVVHVDVPPPKAHRPQPAGAVQVIRAHATHRPIPRPVAVKIRDPHARPVRAPHRGIVIAFVEPARARHAQAERRWRQAHPVRAEVISRHPPRAWLVHHVAERYRRGPHAPRRPDYRRVHMLWGGQDPYLYDVDPRAWEPPPGW